MRVILQPSVYLISRPGIDAPELRRFLGDIGHPEWAMDAPCDAQKNVEVAGRICYMSFGGGRTHSDYIAHILEVGHGSVTEHAVWSLIVTGVSRSLSHELVRHRHLSPSQLSQRYVDSSDVAFVLPPGVSEGTAEYGDWYDACARSLAAYATLADRLGSGAAGTEGRKRVRQAARSVLPNCAETRLFLTGNARAWRNLLELRASAAADAEFRRLANAVHEVLLREAPDLFGDYLRRDLGDGTYELTTANRKV